MKAISAFLLSFTFALASAQQLVGEPKTFAVTQKWFHPHNDFKEVSRKEITVFDRNAQVIRRVQFGFTHNVNLNLVGDVDTYTYDKGRLAWYKSYANGSDYFRDTPEYSSFYWYENDRLQRVTSDFINHLYTYDDVHKKVEWTETDSEGEVRKYYKQYDLSDHILEIGEQGNWARRYTRRKDTLTIIESNAGDTVKTEIQQIYSKNKLITKVQKAYGVIQREHYRYDDDDRLICRLSKNQTCKTVYRYLPDGIVGQIMLFELKNGQWVATMRIDFEHHGKTSILDKKEKQQVNALLIGQSKGWLE